MTTYKIEYSTGRGDNTIHGSLLVSGNDVIHALNRVKDDLFKIGAYVDAVNEVDTVVKETDKVDHKQFIFDF